eukprot:Phypoly_transcript_07966.p1 GENE.Phypoly_transcript_07966~~Phypoly_transcript_07966.p1  ORF type:complete len:256 (-),score=39.20 Phypoly_transcript_07966:37-804(-)
MKMPLDSSFEPSDAVWDNIRQRLWMVSDEGQLASMTFDGTDIKYWTFDDSVDLEGLVQIAGRDGSIYLQQENSKNLLEFDVLTGTLVNNLTLGGMGGFESVAWIKADKPENAVLYSGNQPEGKVSVNSLDFGTGNTVFVETFSLPPPNPGDLSALSYEVDTAVNEEHLTALYDTSKLMVLYTRPVGERSNLAWRPTKQWSMPDRGSEGIAWADVNGIRYFFVCVDTSKGYEPKVRSVFRYSGGFEDECFGAEAIL